MKKTDSDYIMFELDDGEVIRVHQLKSEDIMDPRNDLVEWPNMKGEGDLVLQTPADYSNEMVKTYRHNARAFRICDTGELALRVVGVYHMSRGYKHAYSVKWVAA